MKLLEIFATALLTVGCTVNNNTAGTKMENNAHTITYLALGDSYTIGESVPAEQSFPYQLAAQLHDRKIDIADPQIIATTGWTTGALIAAIGSAQLTKKYNIVTLLIGVNNQYQGIDIATYHKEFTKLLNTAISLANGGAKHVYVLSIPDYSVTPFAANSDKEKIAKELAAYNAYNKQESERLHVSYIDITPISLQAANDASLLADDGLHPSGKMYGLWVEKLLPKVLEELDDN
ncbi:SGNH/GDSL hydrolase family protein [Mucilaginibacter ginkgonis]|uniref:SGNH/GDSL hydrolase family protein n=1 Tax=Mucilaginibacter ginkgonis TaxID=2682091 RepID=A0A6I4HZB1_9SPHI|nr:SGNH/GDSL hydrolase family protein [Mucilaginibacter ginkgonis]QQL48769.1 SGNH/GDSL hydrolase family protein [Mucilaginibacter ginkgonis]